MLVGIGDVAVEIERPVIPMRIVVHHEFEKRMGGAEDAAERCPRPSRVRCRAPARIDFFAGSRVVRPFVNLFERVDLRRGQAGIGVLTNPAQKAAGSKGQVSGSSITPSTTPSSASHSARRVIDKRERSSSAAVTPAERRLAVPHVFLAVVDLVEVGGAPTLMPS